MEARRSVPVEVRAAAPIEVRALRTHDDFVRCVELQHDVWGPSFTERVSVGILKVVQRIGGIAAGAFEPDGRLVGFVFGLTGVEDGRIVHWSDMLAVREHLRDHGIGRRLKEFQRDTVRQVGVSRIYWTFDPLVSRNAHFNLNRLGAHVVEYVPDMYGADTNSVLHRGVGTDRFIVAWDIDGGPHAVAPDDDPRGVTLGTDHPVLNPLGADRLPAFHEVSGRPLVVLIVVPDSIEDVQAESVEHAARWRASTRRAFQWALGAGYRVTAFFRDGATPCGYYVCER